MKSHGLEMLGKISSSDEIDAIEIESGTGKVTILTDLEADGTAQLDGTVKITGGSPSPGKVLLATDGNGTLSWSYGSIPSGEIFLFEKDTAVTGYTLLTGFDDGVVYITKGSAAGGETGGTNKSGGTWSHSTHSHGGGGNVGYHALTLSEIPSHYHTLPSGIYFFTVYSIGGEQWSENWEYLQTQAYYTGYSGGLFAGGPARSHTHSGGSLSSDSCPNTWRPYGRNFTRQQKN